MGGAQSTLAIVEKFTHEQAHVEQFDGITGISASTEHAHPFNFQLKT